MTNWSIAYSVFGGRSLGCTTSSTLDVLVDRADVGRERAHLHLLVQLRDAGPARVHAAGQLVELSIDRQRRDHADGRLLRVAEPMNQARHVVLEKLFLVRLEERDDFAAVGRVRAGETEVQRVVARAQRHGLQAELRGAVFVFRERLGIDGR